MFGDDWETLFDEVWGDVPRLLCWWKASSLGASFLYKSLHCLLYAHSSVFFFLFYHQQLSCSLCAVMKRPRLKSRYKDRMEAIVKYTKKIDDFDDLIDP